jgi:hypothetical protein
MIANEAGNGAGAGRSVHPDLFLAEAPERPIGIMGGLLEKPFG